jgi:tetratricopeptide (TPR) repeat protein
LCFDRKYLFQIPYVYCIYSSDADRISKRQNFFLKEKIMKQKRPVIIALGFILAIFFTASTYTMAQGPPNCPPDKALCAKMIRFGKEAYARGKYLDAKEYFRKAVKADPTSLTAWRYYDQTVIFGLAEKVEKNANLVLPDVSTRQEPGVGLPPTVSPVPPAAATDKPGKSEFKIIEDEGC